MLKNKKGVSLITLIITIIVVIILAVIVMIGTGGTIEQANYSSYMDDLGKVKEAVKTKAMEVKGEYLIDGRVVSMEEIYHYVAKGGKTGEDFVGKANVPAYTIIDREKADIGIEIPTRNIESGTARNVEIQYIVTKEGEVFTWPPYEYEDKLYITENITLAGKLDKNIQIGDESFTLEFDENLGIILSASGDISIGGGTGNEGDSGSGSEGEQDRPNPEFAEIDVGEYVIYNSDKGDIECRVWEVKANGDIVIMPSRPVGTLKLGYVDGTTGPAKVASAATSYLNAETSVQNYCKEYTSATLGVTASDIESLTIEEVNRKTGYNPVTEEKYAYYAIGSSVSGTTVEADGLAGYKKAAHYGSLSNELTIPRFYTYDYAKNTTTDEEGNTYAFPTATDPVFVSSTHYYYDPDNYNTLISSMLGSEYGWLASTGVTCDNDYSISYVRLASNRSDLGGFYYWICHSFGGANYDTRGVRPLVTLTSALKLDSSVSGMDGSSTNPWRFVK